MSALDWRDIPSVDPAAFTEARLVAHWAAQLPAAFAGRLPALPDQAHTALSWSPEHGALMSGISPGQAPLRAGLRLADLSALLVDGRGRRVDALPLAGQTLASALRWLGSAVGAHVGAPVAAYARPELTLPDHPVGQGAAFPEPDRPALEALAAWFHDADALLRTHPGAPGGAPPVRVWPHHFDAAALHVLDADADPERARSIGLGMTPGDGGQAEPYWYALPWPEPAPEALGALSVGRWETRRYVGAELAGERDPNTVRRFFEEAVAELRRLLARAGAKARLTWYKAADHADLPEGRVKSVTCGRKTVCLTHHEGRFAALDNRCPHQGGPLGDGTIEGGVLRCPWHGWDYHPTTGRSVGPYDDGVETFEVDVRDDGVYVGIPEPAPRATTVSDVMVKTFTAWGLDTVFGMVGHSNLGLAEGLRRASETTPLRYFGIRHEGAAAFAASAYGKLTGRPAACLSIAGPGATNLLTGLWDAHVDRAPVLALTGQVDTQVLGPGAFQEIDLKAAYGGVARWSQVVLRDSRHVELANLAMRSALLERGVAHLVFPDEVQTAPSEAAPGSPEGRLPDLGVRPAPSAVDAAVARIGRTKRPCFIVGHGARFHIAPILALAEQLGAPVLTTFKGKGLVPDDHPLAGGVLGRSGTPVASWLMNEAELLVVFGASFSNHTGITSYKPIVQVDFEPTQLARFHPVALPLLGEIEATVALLAEGLSGARACVDQRAQVAERWRLWRAEKASREKDDLGRGLGAATVFAALGRQAPRDAIIPVDVGNNTYAFGRYFEATGQAVLMSGYLGSIGFALPAAMGAWAATSSGDPAFAGRKVISVSGDGGLAQYLAEITTLVRYEMDVCHVVLDNGQLGKITKEQRAAEHPVWQTELVNPDFAAFADSCGARGFTARRPAELDATLAEAIAHPGPALIHVHTDAELV